MDKPIRRKRVKILTDVLEDCCAFMSQDQLLFEGPGPLLEEEEGSLSVQAPEGSYEE